MESKLHLRKLVDCKTLLAFNTSLKMLLTFSWGDFWRNWLMCEIWFAVVLFKLVVSYFAPDLVIPRNFLKTSLKNAQMPISPLKVLSVKAYK